MNGASRKLTQAVQRALRPFGVQLRRIRGGTVPEPLPMIPMWLDQLDYFRRMMARIEGLPGDVVECGVGGGA